MGSELFAFYGSLRRGMENYDVYKDDLLYLYSTRLRGYKLYLRGQYPVAVKTGGTETILVEVFQVRNPSTAQSIHRLEMDEGYYVADEVINGKKTIIYLVDDAENYPEVPDGDWVTFFRQRGNWT